MPEEQRFTNEVVPMITNDSDSKEDSNENNSLELRKSPYVCPFEPKKKNNFQLKPIEVGPENIQTSSDDHTVTKEISSGRNSIMAANKD